MNLKKGYTAQELANFQLKSLPHTRVGVMKKGKKEGWITDKRMGKGGGVEYAFDALPANVQAEIKAKLYRSLLKLDSCSAKENRKLALSGRDLAKLSHAQRATADARLRMALLVAQYEVDLGSRVKAVALVSRLSREGALPDDYNEVCRVALAKTRKGLVGVGQRKLHQWCIDADHCETGADRLRLLAPQKQGQPVIEPIKIAWLPDFMAVYRNTNGMNVAEAYRIFAVSYGAKHGVDAVPHIDAVRRALAKVPAVLRERGRMTGSYLKQLLTYVRRDWNTSWFVNNDVWVGDGHSLKLKVAHPEHGRPFTPELTVIMDAPSRFIVGWSLSYSESTLAVADALRHAMVNYGIPAIYYSDNGSGQTNKVLDADLVGILPRLGVHHETGIAGNPQGRGIIERFMQTVPRLIAQQFETFYGRGADREATRKRLVAVNSLAKAESLGRSLTPLQQGVKGQLPTWQQLLDVIGQAIDWYNNEHVHRAIGTTPRAYREALAQKMVNDGIEVVPLSEVEARDMFRPAFKRKVQRGYIEFLHQVYWHKDLELLNGQTVVIYVDIHDASSVIVRELDGYYVCDAMLDGNKCDAFPKSLVERERENRANRRIQKLQDEIRKAESEKRLTLEADTFSIMSELLPIAVQKKKHKLVMFACDLENNQKQQVVNE